MAGIFAHLQAKHSAQRGWPVPGGATVTAGQPAGASLLMLWAPLITPQESDGVPLMLCLRNTGISAQVGWWARTGPGAQIYLCSSPSFAR